MRKKKKLLGISNSGVRIGGTTQKEIISKAIKRKLKGITIFKENRKSFGIVGNYKIKKVKKKWKEERNKDEIL